MANSTRSPRFSEDTLKFILKASKQSRADWLEKNHDQYETVLLKPLKNLAQTLQSELVSVASGYHFPQKGIGRIKRGAHRAKEWGMYKDWVNYSASRPHPSRFESNPSLYFEIDPTDKDGDHIIVAGGLYMPSSGQVRAIRHAISLDGSDFEALFKTKEFSKRFKGGFSKDRISSRNPRGFDPTHPRLEWLKLQAFFVWKPYSIKDFASAKFPMMVVEDFKQILKMNVLLERAIHGANTKKTSPAFQKKTTEQNSAVQNTVARSPSEWDF